MQNVSTAYKYKESDAKLISRFLSIDYMGLSRRKKDQLG